MSKLNEIIIDRKVPSTMSDGTVLYSDVYRPKEPGRYPVIVVRVAYELDSRTEPYAEWYASRGYVFVGQSSRGTYWSEGEWIPFADDGWGEHKDGYDTIEWAAAQPWSNGNVGTVDGSYSGFTQNLLAPTRPPHLKAMFSRMAPARWADFHPSGNLFMRLFYLIQALNQARHPSASPELQSKIGEIEELLNDPEGVFGVLPVRELPFLDKNFPGVAKSLDHSLGGPLYTHIDATLKVSDIDTPIFHLGGWFDIFLNDTTDMFTGVSERGYSEQAQESQRLLIGPWVHGPVEPDARQQGDLDFGAESILGINEFRKRWFDHYLNDEKNGADALPRVRLFVMGSNEWRDYESWPPEGATETKLFLHEESLSFEEPSEESASTSYDYDPFDPVPFYNGGRSGFDGFGPIDLAPSEDRLTLFTSEPLEQPITVVGPISVKLFASSSAKDTDWFVTLTDVYPDGRSIRIRDGSLRARHREGLDREVMMEPSQSYIFDIDLGATALEFAAGHHIRLAITSSQFPTRERNMNTGENNAEETEGIVAHNTILHERSHASHLVLPVMPN